MRTLILCIVLMSLYSLAHAKEIMYTYEVDGNNNPGYLTFGEYDFRFYTSFPGQDPSRQNPRYILLGDEKPGIGGEGNKGVAWILANLFINIRRSDECNWQLARGDDAWRDRLAYFWLEKDNSETPEEGKIYTYQFKGKNVQIYFEKVKFIKGWRYTGPYNTDYAPVEEVKFVTFKIIIE